MRSNRCCQRWSLQTLYNRFSIFFLFFFFHSSLFTDIYFGTKLKMFIHKQFDWYLFCFYVILFKNIWRKKCRKHWYPVKFICYVAIWISKRRWEKNIVKNNFFFYKIKIHEFTNCWKKIIAKYKIGLFMYSTLSYFGKKAIVKRWRLYLTWDFCLSFFWFHNKRDRQFEMLLMQFASDILFIMFVIRFI